MAVEQSQVLNKTFTTKKLSQIENLKLVTDSVQVIWYANVTKKWLAYFVEADVSWAKSSVTYGRLECS